MPALNLTSSHSCSCCSHYSVDRSPSVFKCQPSGNITNIRNNFQDQSWIRVSYSARKQLKTIHYFASTLLLLQNPFRLLELFASCTGPRAVLSHTNFRVFPLVACIISSFSHKFVCSYGISMYECRTESHEQQFFVK